MADRWTLSRAGILNVYQYGDEVLQFGGGRLLLRGVNGSGKSTAMNMLLPFLVEADVRRIDAAGEQTGVLRSWMLSGRDEQQPVGYLWIEFERGDEHLVCGCGIRANQSTQKATTWWFVTSRRPGIDLQLVTGRVPLNVEQLRNELGHHAVFTQDQRSAYRARVRGELFGNADIDQHLRLLHIVRSPRVGDRIDSELTAYLNDALPQLSDEAIDDAARPLQDLEEHRRSVAALSATAEALDGLCDVYRSYAATEARRHAATALQLVDEARSCRRRERAAIAAERQAADARTDAAAAVTRLDADMERLAAELAALKEQPAYRKGKRLEDLRGRVSGLTKLIDEAQQQVATRRMQLETARNSVSSAAGEAGSDLRSLLDALSDIAALAVQQGLGAFRIDAPTVATELLTDEPTATEPTATEPTSTPQGLRVPTAELNTEPLRAATANLLGAVAARRGDLDQVRRLLFVVDAAEQALSESERALEAAQAAADAAQHRSDEARAALEQATTEFVERLRSWVTAANALVLPDDRGPAAVALAALPDPTIGVDVIDARAELIAQLAKVVDDTSESLRTDASAITARRTIDIGRVEELSRELERLRSLPEPEVPRSPWQHDEGIVLGQLVDFADGLDTDEKLGFEAALEASGLLAASIHDAGAALRHGELVVTAASAAVEHPLTAVLTVVVPEELQGRVDGAQVRRALESISTDTDAADVNSVIAADGSFRFGALQGRHVRTDLALVGAAARFAALQRQVAALDAERSTVQAVVDRSDAELRAITTRIEANRSHCAALPTTRALDRALDVSERTDQDATTAAELVATRRAERDAAEATVSNASEALRRSAATAGLPFTSDGLEQAASALSELADRTRAVDGLSTALTRSTVAWIRAGHAHAGAVDEVHQAQTTLDRRVAEHHPLAMRLATAEDALGVDYDEIVAAIDRSETEHEHARIALPDARAVTDQRVAELAERQAATGTAQRASAAAEHTAGAELPRLRKVLAVPGFLDALQPSGGEQLSVPVVTESADGVAELAAALLAGVAEPVAPATAESVRQSLRQRRDRLGANWDAGDRQPDETAPCEVEVTGPLGQGRMPLVAATVAVHAQLDNLTSLLTAQQDQALRNLLQGLIAKEVSRKLHAARELVSLMNQRLAQVSTAHGISARLRWSRRDDLDDSLQSIVTLMATTPDLRTEAEDATLAAALSSRLDEARRAEPEAPYDQLIGQVLDYRQWHEMAVMLERPGRSAERLTRRTALSEGEKKVVSYLPLFAAVAASCDALAESDPTVPRFVLLDDAFAKVSEDNHPKLFGLLVDLDLDFIATSERLWGTYSTVPELAITEVVRDARSGVILLEHARWDGTLRSTR